MKDEYENAIYFSELTAERQEEEEDKEKVG